MEDQHHLMCLMAWKGLCACCSFLCLQISNSSRSSIISCVVADDVLNIKCHCFFY